jgi:hypothetical protein
VITALRPDDHAPILRDPISSMIAETTTGGITRPIARDHEKEHDHGAS